MEEKSIFGSKHYYLGRKIKKPVQATQKPKPKKVEVQPYIDALINSRISSGFTQAALAKAINTRQSVISRFENGHGSPSLSFISRYAKAIGAKIVISVK